MLLSDEDRIQDIRKELAALLNYTKNLTREDLHNYWDPKKVVRDAFIVMGEAASNVSKDCIKEWSAIPWVDLIDLRNIVAHHYNGVDFDTVFDVIENELPRLKEKLDYMKLPQVKLPKMMPIKKKPDLLNKSKSKASGLLPKNKRKGKSGF